MNPDDIMYGRHHRQPRKMTATQKAWRKTCKKRREAREIQKQRLRETQALLEDFNGKRD